MNLKILKKILIIISMHLITKHTEHQDSVKIFLDFWNFRVYKQ